MSSGQISGVVTGAKPSNFADCVKKAGVGTTGITEADANLIVSVSKAENTAVDLLAVTFQGETSFDMYHPPNTNDTDDRHFWDYGPFQVNAHYLDLAIQKGEINIDGINEGDAMGGLWVGAGLEFVGDPVANGQIAAKVLNHYGTGAKAAGLYVGNTGPNPAKRRAMYNTWSAKYRMFFDCFNK